MAEIAFKSNGIKDEDNNQGAVFSPDDYFVASVIDDFQKHINVIVNHRDRSTYKANQAQIDESESAYAYAHTFVDMEELNLDITLGDDIEFNAFSASTGYELILKFSNYVENITGNIKEGIEGNMNFSQIDAKFTSPDLSDYQIYTLELKGKFYIDSYGLNIIKPIDLVGNLSSIIVTYDHGNGKGISEFKYIDDKTFSSNDSLSKDYFKYLTKGKDTFIGTSYNDVFYSGDNDDIFHSSRGSDQLYGGKGIDTVVYTKNFANYKFKRESDHIEVELSQHETINSDGKDHLYEIEFIQFTDQTVETEKVDKFKTYNGSFTDYKFYNKGNSTYEIKTKTGYDDVTGIPKLIFRDKTISAIIDVEGTFDLITGLNTDSGEMFRFLL